jgi:hypothetical protein
MKRVNLRSRKKPTRALNTINSIRQNINKDGQKLYSVEEKQ